MYCYIHISVNEPTRKSYQGPPDRRSEGCTRRGEAACSDGGDRAAVQADQAAGHASSGRRCAGLVQEARARLSDPDQWRAAESDGGGAVGLELDFASPAGAGLNSGLMTERIGI
jgi:hypothetical protein